MTTATKASARETLKESAKTIKSLTAAIERNREALDEARAQAQQAEETLEGFDTLSTQISKWRAGEIKAKRSPGRLPDHLRDKQAARTAATEELELSNETADLLERELIDDKSKLAQLNSALMPVAAEVVHQEAVAPLAQELQALNKRKYELETMIRAWSNLRIVDANGWVSLGHQYDVLAALSPYGGPEFVVSARPAELQTARYKQLVDKLLEDADMPIQAPALVQPSDFHF
jgi:DNA repair exonuclease SbcCD ATPase subunit